ncbi:MAG: hypothetical protein WDM96_19335 [Lacunisphaera sp.]
MTVADQMEYLLERIKTQKVFVFSQLFPREDHPAPPRRHLPRRPRTDAPGQIARRAERSLHRHRLHGRRGKAA